MFFLLSCWLPVSSFAQSDEGALEKSMAVSGGVGLLIFNGDVGEAADVSSFSTMRLGYGICVEKYFGKWIGVGLNGVYGKLAQGERSKTRNYNFESPLIQGDLRLIGVFDNDIVFSTRAIATPYIFAGVGYMLFDPKGDLLDASGKPYNYWTDGSIRDLPQTSANLLTAKIVQRDYTYETTLKDSLTSYARNSIMFPMGLGFKMKFSDNIGVNLDFTYYMTLTDYVDNVKNGGNDGYLYASMSFKYTFLKKTQASGQYKDVDYANIDKLDSDGDGVKDIDDKCLNTPKGVKADREGCPVDSDNDGVPDYLDKERGSRRGAVVDENGVTITDKMLAEQALRDSIARSRGNTFVDAPSLGTLQQIDKEVTSGGDSGVKKSLPPKYAFADKNGNGIISSDEITAVIDSFFEGSADVTVERINELIDFFFEQ